MKQINILQEDSEVVEKKNKGFTQVYPAGWEQLLNLPSKSPHVARLYALLAKHTTPLAGAVCVSYDTMAEALGISKMTARRSAEYLVENGIVVRFKQGAGAFIYALNPDEVWKSAHKHKEYAAFHTQSLVSRRDTEALELQVRMLQTKCESKKPMRKKGSKKQKAELIFD